MGLQKRGSTQGQGARPALTQKEMPGAASVSNLSVAEYAGENIARGGVTFSMTPVGIVSPFAATPGAVSANN